MKEENKQIGDTCRDMEARGGAVLHNLQGHTGPVHNDASECTQSCVRAYSDSMQKFGVCYWALVRVHLCLESCCQRPGL